MIVNALIVLCISVFVFLYLKWRRVKNYWADRGVPHFKPNPLYGSLHFLLKENAGIWMLRTYNHFKTPYNGIWLLWKPTLMVNTPELARNILIRDSANFRNRYPTCSPRDRTGNLNLSFVKDPLWSTLRRRFTKVFTSSKLKHVHVISEMKAKDLLKRIENNKDGYLDLRMLFTDLTTDIFGMASFGVTSNATLTGDGPLRSITKDMMGYSILRGVAWSSIFFWPQIVDFFRFTLFPKHTIAYFRKILREAILLREKETVPEESKDLIDALIELKNEFKEDEDYSEDITLAQAAIFLLGSFDSTGTVLTFTTYELAFNPEMQEKLYDELINSKKGNGDDDMLESSRLPYLDAIIKEILRKYPSMGWLDRVATNDYQVDDNLRIEAGTPVYINTFGMHHDPRYFPDPYTFNPDRFLPENENKLTPFTYMPFGEGPRICIGKRYGMVALRNILTALFLKYKVVPVPNSIRPEKVSPNSKAIFYVPGETLSVQFIPRQ